MLESLTVNVISVAAAAAVGVPEMTPVEVLSVSPAGRAPEGIEYRNGVLPPLIGDGRL